MPCKNRGCLTTLVPYTMYLEKKEWNTVEQDHLSQRAITLGIDKYAVDESIQTQHAQLMPAAVDQHLGVLITGSISRWKQICSTPFEFRAVLEYVGYRTGTARYSSRTRSSIPMYTLRDALQRSGGERSRRDEDALCTNFTRERRKIVPGHAKTDACSTI